MASIGDFFSEQHRACDELFEDMEAAVSRENWQMADALFNRLNAETLQHFVNEEQGLFPLFEEKTGMQQGPTGVMRAEHVELRELLQQIRQGVHAKDRERVLSAAETFFLLLQQHNIKEEQVLYPMADQALQDSLEELAHRVPGFTGDG